MRLALVISSRVGAAFAVVLAVVAVALSVVAFMATIRDNGDTIGRFVQSRKDNQYTGDPVLFPLDEFYIGRGTDAKLHAFYVYPPGYYGHGRGCKVVWDPLATLAGASARSAPGFYVDPCSGARFDRDGELADGDAERGLDHFATLPGIEGAIVDTRKLICGKALPVIATPGSGDETPTPTPEPKDKTCERVSPNTKKP